MSRRKKSAPAESVVRQARQSLKAGSEPVGTAAAEKANIPAARIDQSPDPKTGAQRLRVILPQPKEPKIFDFSSLLLAPAWAQLLVEGFRIRAQQNRATTIYTEYRNLLVTGSFLAEAAVSPEQADEALWASYVAWLNAPQEAGEPWAQKTRREVNSVLLRTLRTLLDHQHYGTAAEQILERSGFPSNPWPGSERKVIPTPVLTPDERLRLIEVCLAEIEEVHRRHAENEIVIQQGKRLIAEARASGEPISYSDVGVCAARLDELSSSGILTVNDLRAMDSSLMQAIGREHGGLKSLRSILYATNRDLVPFVVLLGIRTAFNGSTVLGLKWSNIHRSHDGRTISITGSKPRAANAQTSSQEASSSSCDAPSEVGIAGGLSDILKTLEMVTERARLIAEITDRDYLFVAAQLAGHVGVVSFSQGSHFGDRIPPKAFNEFRERHRLPDFSLKMIRATEAEEEYRRTGDVLAIKDRMGHKNAQITRTHYTSDWVRRHGQDRIGATQELILRWAKTDGRSDPRGLRDPRDAPAASRGFGCLDPYDSPRPGQKKGRLCDAYGECPSCPLMLAKPRDTQSVAYYMELRSAILAGKWGVTSGKAWAERWGPILLDLEKLIEEIPLAVKEAASLLRVTLPPVA